MKHQLALFTILLLAPLTALPAADAPSKKPNFVVIVADDHTYRAIGYNNPVVKTPNLDKLASEGIRLRSRVRRVADLRGEPGEPHQRRVSTTARWRQFA